jgi:DNA-directed RNA polymerase specialized sigma24 family protein
MPVASIDEVKRSGPDVWRVDRSSEEAALIRKIVGGQQDLFGELIAPYLSPLSRIVRTIVGGHSEVEDIVQQTALKAFTHLAQFRFEAGFRTWLTQIAINEARQWRRKHAHLRYLERLDLTTQAVKTRHRRARQKVAGFLERSRNFRLRTCAD